jgi:putrescine transport system permease protein
MLIFSKVKMGISPDINALAALIIGTVTFGVAVAGVLMFRTEKRASAARGR